jgi:hypothetical protein
MTLRTVPIRVTPTLTSRARVTTPPAKMVRYASKVGSAGKMGMTPPDRVISCSLARLVAMMFRNGYSTRRQTTVRATPLTAMPTFDGRSIQGARPVLWLARPVVWLARLGSE